MRSLTPWILVLVGCAGPPVDPESPHDAGPTVPRVTPYARSVGEACTLYADALCRTPSSTCEPWSMQSYRDAVDCVEATRTKCVKDAQVPGAVADLVALEDCAAALRAPDCPGRLAALRSPLCRPPAGVLRGRLPVGSPCHANAQCVSGACTFGGAASGACGECVIASHPGQFCLDDDGCSHVGVGTTDEGLYCDIAIRACVPRNEQGAACTRDGECVDGLQCLGRKCAVGTAHSMFPCGDGKSGCDPWSRCASEEGEPARCWPITFGEEGAPCSEKSATDLRRCRGSLVCRFGTCQATQALGDPCTKGSNDCGTEATCGDDAICVPFTTLCGQG